MSEWSTLVSPEDLAERLGSDGVIVVDARVDFANPAASRAAYLRDHLPGARFASLEEDLSDHRKQGAGRHPWPDSDAFARVLGEWGVTPAHQVVVYDAGDGALAAARVWFMLRAFGHHAAAVLDGGWREWIAKGLPVESGVPHPQRTEYPGRFDESRLLDAEQVREHVQRGGLLMDARAAERFRGEVEPLDPVAGHVPGAVNRPYTENLSDGRFKSPQRLAEEFGRRLDGHAPADVAVMCGSGVTACHHLLAMEHAGLGGAKLFTGSWSGWVSDPQRPVATGG